MNDVTCTMPITLTPEMIRVIRNHPTTSIDDKEEWYTRLGWLLCAYDVLVELRLESATEAES